MPYNLQIIGVGGQGVITLAEVFRSLCQENSIQCTGNILKGGAQRLGTVRAALRIFEHDTPDYRNYSMEIPSGKLDLMIDLEPWEGLRFCSLCSPTSTVIINSAIVPLMLERSNPNGFGDPVSRISQLGLNVVARNFTAEAIDEYGEKKMLNYVMGKYAVQHSLPFFTNQQFTDGFQVITRAEI